LGILPNHDGKKLQTSKARSVKEYIMYITCNQIKLVLKANVSASS